MICTEAVGWALDKDFNGKTFAFAEQRKYDEGCDGKRLQDHREKDRATANFPGGLLLGRITFNETACQKS